MLSKIKYVQELSEHDLHRHNEFSERMMELITKKQKDKDKIIGP